MTIDASPDAASAGSTTGTAALRIAGATPDGFVPDRAPRLSWASTTSASDWVQVAAELECTRGDETATAAIDGDGALHVEWPFEPLADGERATVRVRTRGNDGAWLDWSERVAIATSARSSWDAAWISLPGGAGQTRPVRFRAELPTSGPVASATLYATSRGVHQAFIDGVAVDDERMKPGWTTYGRRDVYVATDVTPLVAGDSVAVEIVVAAGWFGEEFGFHGSEKRIYEGALAAAATLRVVRPDGTVDEFHTGEGWEATPDGRLVASGLYEGETLDATAAQGYQWEPVAVEAPSNAPEPRIGPPVRPIETRAVEAVITTPSGRTVLDFGQNLVGHVRVRVAGERGARITVRHAEVLEHGELGTRPLRRAAATDHFVLSGEGTETLEPQFTFHGFRYAEIDGWPGDMDPSVVEAVVVHSEMRRTGWFETSHALLQRLHENVVWSMKGNFLSIPTDCPQRDERLGWTGDIQVFSPTASFLHDADAFLDSWLRDLALEQTPDGSVPFVVPDVLESAEIGTAAWGDAATVVPWTLYERFGDVAVLRRQYPSMLRWVEWVAERAGKNFLWEDDFQFGDWLDPTAPPDQPAAAKADRDLIATAHLYRSADIVAKAAAVLGIEGDVHRIGALASNVRAAWLAEYATPAGRLMSDAQAAYAVAIAFGLVSGDQRAAMGERLAEMVQRTGYRISTGFVGTPLIADALSDTGHADIAGRLVLNDENPSWLYAVTMGATTIWERWDSMLEDGTINPGEMTSFNHYALGAIADWLHRRLAGLAPGEPGYHRVVVAPLPVDGVDTAAARFESAYGTHEAGWARDGASITVRVVVPPNTSAVVRLPGAAEVVVGSGAHEWTVHAPASQEPQPVSSASTLAQIRDHEEGYRRFLDALEAQLGPDGARWVLRVIDWSPAMTIRSLPMIMQPETILGLERALDGDD